MLPSFCLLYTSKLRREKSYPIIKELEAALKEIIAEVGAAGPQDMGKVMGVATKKLAGKARCV